MFGWSRGKKEKTPEAGAGQPDFSMVDSQDKAIGLFGRGALEKLLLMPEEFGGEDIPPNTVYVPPGVAAAKARIDAGTVAPLAGAGKITRYSAEPAYLGRSFVPSTIRIHAWDPGEFIATITIWGGATTDEEQP